jgi:hypothetical protein
VFNILQSVFLQAKKINFHSQILSIIMKKIISLLFAVLIIAGCDGKEESKNQAGTQTSVKQVPVTVVMAEFEKRAPELVGKEIIITGIVDHTCKHSGKRMFLVDDKSDASLKVEAGKNIDQFNASLTGSTVEVRGIIKELIIDNNKLDEWEENPDLNGENGLKMNDDNHDKVKDEAEEHEKSEKVKILKQKLEKSGKDHISFYSLECIEYKVIKK